MKIYLAIITLALAFNSHSKDISVLISQHIDWLETADICPSDVMTIQDDSIAYLEHACDRSVDECFLKCSKGDGESCYNLAFTLQAEEYSSYVKYSEALFLKACELGSISACTNRAAGLQKYEGKASLECAIKTYEKACEFDDPWSCTMFGYQLAVGEGVEKDLNKSLEVFGKSCKYGESDPACTSALKYIGQIEDILEKRN